ncbi:hypothetical protein BH23PLA1_BH23PLA1_08120 [soil metagenome]
MILAWIVVALTALVALIWFALTARLGFIMRRERFLKPVQGPVPTLAEAETTAIDLIVAAHNEEREIEACVRSLLAQDYPSLRITVVNDQSTDATGAILDRLASEARAGGGHPLRIVQGVERPEGWLGKTWALQQGLEGIEADWLLFVDGDMKLHPKAVLTAFQAGQDTGADLVSILPGVRCESFWQKVAAIELSLMISHIYPLARINNQNRPEALAAGGFLMVRRELYEGVGGHEAVRREIVEDIQLARRIKGAGGRLLVKGAPDLASTHMYGTLGEIWRGLRKNAYAGMEYQIYKYVTGAIGAIWLAWTPLLALIWGLAQGFGESGLTTAPLIAVGLLGILAQATAAAPFVWALRLPIAYAFSLPVGISLYVAIASSSVWHHRRGRILWKDRQFSTQTLRS